jgi:hypothetical protein
MTRCWQASAQQGGGHQDRKHLTLGACCRLRLPSAGIGRGACMGRVKSQSLPSCRHITCHPARKLIATSREAGSSADAAWCQGLRRNAHVEAGAGPHGCGGWCGRAAGAGGKDRRVRAQRARRLRRMQISYQHCWSFHAAGSRLGALPFLFAVRQQLQPRLSMPMAAPDLAQ